VLDGNQNQAVASVRSLSRAGHEVWVGESATWSKAGWSRFCRRSFRYSPPQVLADQFVQELAETSALVPGTLVLPMTEATTLPISAQREKLLAAGAQLILPDHADLLRAFDKQQTTRLAASLGIAVPKTIILAGQDQADDLARSISYPVVLKSRASEELSPGGAVRTGGRPRYANTPAQFKAAYRALHNRCSAILVQEYIEGRGSGYFALVHHGELRAEFAHQRIRDVYPTGSGSALRRSVAVDSEVRDASLAILKALRWHGVAMVEFRRNGSSAPVFMEVNGRFWHSLPLACYAGVDFPALLARMAEDGDVAPARSYKIGVPCRWLLGDFRHLVEVWKGPPEGYPGIYPGRWSTLLAELTPTPGIYHDLFQWRDPLPELGDWLFLAQRLLGKLASEGETRA
jgi:predicted ATP-grasp superfamily ATP-dependent carboligase